MNYTKEQTNCFVCVWDLKVFSLRAKQAEKTRPKGKSHPWHHAGKVPVPKDITPEFLNMPAMKFLDFLKTQKREQSLSITIEWNDKMSEFMLIRLKAFLEDSAIFTWKQKRQAVIRATEEQKNGPILNSSNSRNAFASGVKWKKIE